jgi:hypothetical protein
MLGLLWEQDQQSTARAAAPSRSPAPSHR